MKTCGFNLDGNRYLVRDVHALDAADADLWNDHMGVQMDHRGRVLSAGFIQPNMTAYSGPLRTFYLRDEASHRLWSVPFEPIQAEPDEFEFSAGQADLQWTVVLDGIATHLRLVVPRGDNVELWTVTVSNRSRAKRRLSLFAYLPVGRRSFLAQRAYFDPRLGGAIHEFFDYYAKLEDYYRIKTMANVVFCASDPKPRDWELGIAAFHGGQGLHRPAQLEQRRLRSGRHPFEASNEETANIFQYPLSLNPGQSKELRFVFGPAARVADARRLAARYLRPGAMDKALREAERFLARHTAGLRIETPDRDFDYFINHWQSRRALMLVRTQRFNLAPQGRNVIQDAMGGVYVDPQSSRDWFLRIWAHQHTNGWLPHGMPFAPGVNQVPINSIPHKDINSWGPVVLSFYMAETGDFAILDERIPFADKPTRSASLHEHISRGLRWLLNDRTKRGLCRLGQGDWNDPLNMAGMGEKGESVWLSEALSLALDTWAKVEGHRGNKGQAGTWRREAAAMRCAINRYAWNGRWYTRGFKDNGEPFGTPADREGKIFLNSQSWALMCGAADRGKTAACIRAVERLLMTPSGPMKLAPAYTRMDESIGKLSQKIPGWNENGAIYCHAATFYAYALYVAREPDRAFDALRRLLPGYRDHTLERAGQLPIYIPNFYLGDPMGRRAGASSHAPNTGTASWYYRTAIAMLLGVRAEFDGLRIDPQLPRHWKRTRIQRSWRGAEFDIVMRRDKACRSTLVRLDDSILQNGLIGPQQPGSRHVVRVTLPGT
jgi:cellobionic acid phosphorylase